MRALWLERGEEGYNFIGGLLIDEMTIQVSVYLFFGMDTQSVGCVASTFTFGLGCGHFGIRSTVELCRFCVLSLHREVGGVRQYTR